MRRRKIPKGEFQTQVNGLSHEGRGVAEINGKKTFLFNALLNEQVTFEYDNVHNRFDEGHVIAVENPNPQRVPPICQHYGYCGGCALQHLQHNEQIKLKEKTVMELFNHTAQCQPETWMPPLLGPTKAYRKKARLAVKYVHKKDTVLVGFREKRSSKVAVLSQCEILDPSIGLRIEPLRQVISELSIKDQIPQIEVAVTDTEIALVVRHLAPFTDKDIEIFSAFCKEFGFGFYSQSKGPNTVKKIWPQTESHLSYQCDGDISMSFGPLDFTQINETMNEKMVQQALKELDLQPDETALDLFCGIGNFTLPMCRRAKQVTGVELSSTAIDRAKENAAKNNIQNGEFVVQDLFKPENCDYLKLNYDKLLLDPPRSGAQEVLPFLKDINAKTIVYVSCNPATLARDAAVIVHEHGYQLKKLGNMDMFPHTAHVESMAVFTK